jgi:hypothetical protein
MNQSCAVTKVGATPRAPITVKGANTTMASRFVYSTLNGMFVAQLAAWMVTPIDSAAMAAEHPAHPSTTLLSRASDDPGTILRDGWEVSIPKQGKLGELPDLGAHAKSQTDDSPAN